MRFFKKSPPTFEDLIAAAKNGKTRRVRRLLEELPAAQVKKPDYFGLNALMNAAQNGYPEIVQMLLPVSDLRFQTPGNGRNALMWAISACQPEVISLLLPVSDPSQRDVDGNTALHLAAQRYHPKGLELVVPIGDPQAVNKDGQTALVVAIQGGDVDLVKILAKVTDLKSVDQMGDTPLMQALRYDQEASVEVLIDGSDLNYKNRAGETALMMSLSKFNHEGFDVILRKSNPAQIAEAQHAASKWTFRSDRTEARLPLLQAALIEKEGDILREVANQHRTGPALEGFSTETKVRRRL